MASSLKHCLPSMDEIGGVLRRHELPCLVVHLPLRHELIKQLKDTETPSVPEQTRQFATRIGARVTDGSEAFLGMDEAGIRACWLPVDCHWNQTGSDRFAHYMLDAIREWEQKRAEKL